MTSRLDVVDLDIRTPFKDVLQCIIEECLFPYPHLFGYRDNIKGYLIYQGLVAPFE